MILDAFTDVIENGMDDALTQQIALCGGVARVEPIRKFRQDLTIQGTQVRRSLNPATDKNAMSQLKKDPERIRLLREHTRRIQKELRRREQRKLRRQERLKCKTV